MNSRKEAAKNILFADWASKGRDAGYFGLLAAALRHECQNSSPWNTDREHHSHHELGRVKAIEELLFKLQDPLGSQDDKPVPKMPAPTYGTK